MNEISTIRVENLSKCYKMYGSPIARIRGFLNPNDTKYHQSFWALRDLSFEVEKGTTFGIIGQNGSGKSTLLQIISGILRPTEGSVKVSGRISALLELGAGFHREFTGRENVFMQGALMGINKEKMKMHFNDIEEFADIGKFIDRPVKTYSSGMYVRLAFATAINVDPDILIIDEVLAVGDDMFKRRCYRKLDDFKEQGKTILFVSHSLVSITTLCSRALLLDKGHIIEIGSPNDVAKVYNKLLSERDENYQKKASERQNKEVQSQSSEEKVDLAENSTNSEYRYGAGGAEILEVTIVNSKNESLDTIEHGEIFTIKVSVLFKKDMKEPGLGYTIKTLSGVDITGTNTLLSDSPIGQVSSGSTAEVNFKQKMSLNPGSYSLTSGVAENTDKEMIYHDRRMDVKILKVIGKKNSTGFYGMDSKVEITINPEKDSSV